MNSGISNNELTQSYYNLSIAQKREEFYKEFYELFMLMGVLIEKKDPNIKLPNLEELDNLKDPNLDENMYMTGLYEDLLVLKEMFAYYIGDIVKGND